MSEIEKNIHAVKNEFQKQIDTVQSIDQLETVRVTFLGRQGKIKDLMASLKSASVEEKRIIGPLLQELKTFCTQQLEQTEQYLEQNQAKAERKKEQYFDVTAYKQPEYHGHLHPFTQLIEQLENIFISMGYEVADGPEVEIDFNNFEALNIPKEHPARESHDTFWLNIPNYLMRTHTSTVQIHEMQKKNVPLAIFAPGRCYRNEAVDASHDFMFMQGEGLYVDKNVSLANLLATAKAFLQAVFERDDLAMRTRPGYFPFVEPGLEIDAECPFCTDGCSICKKTKWIELLGAGLVHPNVLKACGIDPNEYSGFAFGFGLERIAMIKYGIRDIRLFRSNNVSFLNQF